MQMHSRLFFVTDRFAYPSPEILHTPNISATINNKNYESSTMSSIDSDPTDESISVSSLATPRAFDDDDGLETSSRQTYAEKMYVAEGRSLKALATLSLGLKNNDGTPTFDPSVLPWSAAARPTALKMTAKDLRKEVNRRNVAAKNVLHAPRPSQWTVAKATDWLVNNPIVAADEVSFIRRTISHRILVAERTGLQSTNHGAAPPPPPATASSSSVSGTGNWIGKYPYLRLIHTIIDNPDIKAAYKRRLHVPNGRMAVFGKWLQRSGTTQISRQPSL